MSEFVEILSTNAIKDVQTLTKELAKTVTAVNKVNAAAKGLKIPADFRSSINELNNIFRMNNNLLKQQIKLQEQLAAANRATTTTINEQAQSETRVENARRSNNQRTTEEIVNQNLLARNARQAAMANSTFASSYDRLNAQHAIAARRVQDLIARGRTAEQTQRQYNRELRNAQREFTNLNTRVLAADRAVGRFNRNVGNYPTQAIKGLKDLVAAFGLVGGVAAFAAITKNIFQTTKAIQSLDFALKQVAGSQEAFSTSQEFLARISEDYGIEIQGLTRSYTGFLAASKNAIDAGQITAQQINEIFESVAKASGAMGLSVEQQQGAFLALQQMISKGNVQAEEIRGQLAERLPGAFGILAKSMGVTEQELNKLLKDGKVLAAEVLPAFARELEKAYGIDNLNRVENLAAATTRLSNAWIDLVREITNGDSIITKALIGLVNFTKGAIGGIEELSKSEEARRKDLEKHVEQKSYENQLEILKEIAKTDKELAESTAKSDIREIPQRLKGLREERDAIYQNIEALNEQRDARTKISTAGGLITSEIGVSTEEYKRLTSEIESQETALNRSYALTQNYLGDLRASQEFLKKDPLINPPKDDGKAKKQKQDIDYLKEVYEVRRTIAEQLIKLDEQTMQDEERAYDTRLEAANNFYFQREKLLELDHEEQLRLNDLEYKNQKEAYEKGIKEGTANYKQLDQLNYQHVLKKKKIDEEYENGKFNLSVESAKKLKGVLDQITLQRSLNYTAEKDLQNLDRYNDKLDQLLKTGADYREFQKIEKSLQKENTLNRERDIQAEIINLESLRSVTEYGSTKRLELDNQILAKQKELSAVTKERYDEEKEKVEALQRATENYLQTISSGVLSDFGFNSLNLFTQIEENGKTAFQNLMTGANTMQEKFAVAFTAVTSVAQEAFAFLNQNQQAFFDAQRAHLQQEQELALKYAGDSSEAQREIQEQYEERQREIRMREAKAQKETAIFNAIINTAQGVTAALAKANIPLSVIIGALGAAQIAMISSRQIPAYKMGTAYHPGGAALVNDAPGSNYRELVKEPGKEGYIPEGRNRLLNLPKGTKVFKAGSFEHQLNDMLNMSGIDYAARAISANRMPDIKIEGNGATAAEFDAIMDKHISKIRNTNIEVDRRGYGVYVSTSGGRVATVNRYSSFKGKSI